VGSPGGYVRTTGHLSVEERAAVERLVDAAARVDGVRALDEQATLLLRTPAAATPPDSATRPASVHLLAGDGSTGYARLDRPPDGGGDATGDVVVHPDHRGHGLGRAAGTPVRVWAHGPHPAAGPLAAATGFTPVRHLAWMRRSLVGPQAPPLPDVSAPAGVTIRTFSPGHDEQAWLAANAAAFADHLEQGRWTRADLDARLEAPWFDPAGFFVAESETRPGRLVGFHWTKVHPSGGTDGGPIGEVYVVGVDPAGQGGGLGKALTIAGLAHLRARGLAEVMLYVDGDNAPAARLYTALGFSRWHTDVMYER
jgi:mycothiol synthase